MPYESLAQERWAHTDAGTKALGGPAKVKEWDAATKGRSLPQKVPAHAQGGIVSNKGYMSKNESYAQGGAVLGRTTNFMKTPDTFREEGESATDETYGKGLKAPKDHVGAPAAKGKSLKAVKPRS